MKAERAMSMFLLFDNSLLFSFSGGLLVVMIAYLTHLTRKLGGFCCTLEYVRLQWSDHETRGSPIEFALALSSIVLGVFLRSGFIWWWRLGGSIPADFPFFRTAAGDIFVLIGFVCAVRLAAKDRLDQWPYLNWPWMVTAVFGLAFAAASVIWSSRESLGHTRGRATDPMTMNGDVGECGRRTGRSTAIRWLHLPTSKPYDGGIVCGPRRDFPGDLGTNRSETEFPTIGAAGP